MDMGVVVIVAVGGLLLLVGLIGTLWQRRRD